MSDESPWEKSEGGVATDRKVDKPRRYKVLLHNDDYTTMEFVVMVLKRIFGKSQLAAEKVMLQVHNEGVGVCGVYAYEVAETKSKKVVELARKEGHPLVCTTEPE